jgi:hypothetical protein
MEIYGINAYGVIRNYKCSKLTNIDVDIFTPISNKLEVLYAKDPYIIINSKFNFNDYINLLNTKKLRSDKIYFNAIKAKLYLLINILFYKEINKINKNNFLL